MAGLLHPFGQLEELPLVEDGAEEGKEHLLLFGEVLLELDTHFEAGVAGPAPPGASLRQVAVGNFYFEDETVDDGRLEAQAGDQLRFTLLDNGPGTPHTVEVDALGIHSGSLTVGETFTTPPLNQPGTYVLYCKPHLQRGHKTTLVVSGTATTPTTAAPTTTTTQAPATVTTQPTPTAKPPTTSTTAARAVTGGTSASTTTTARPTTTTGKATSPTTVTDGTASAANAPSTGAPGATTAPAGGLTEGETAAGAVPAGDGSNGGLVAVGRGQTDEALGGAAGTSLDAIIGRLPQRQEPWTRSVRLAFAALVPMALAAALTLFRWTRLAAAGGNR